MNTEIEQLKQIIENQKNQIFQLNSIIDSLPGSIYWKDTGGVYLGRNLYAAEKMKAVNLEHQAIQSAVVGKTDYDFFDQETADQYRQHDLEVLEAGKQMTREEAVTLPNGESLVQLSLKRPLYDSKGKVVGIVGNTVDITYLKKIETDLRIAKEKAEKADRMKLEFIYNMEHDIRTPFNGVWMLAQLLSEAEEDEEKKESLTMIAESGKELLDYCNGILDFSKLESGILPIIEKKFDFEQLLQKIEKIEKPALKNKALAFNVDYDSRLPKYLIGDTYRLSRILINLMSNAIKFTEKGRVTLKVALAKLDSDQNRAIVNVCVEDTGIGIPLEHQDLIYEKFSRLTRANTGKYKGLGLGLCAVKKFMAELAGELELESEVGKGSAFTCIIPFKLPLLG